MMKKQVVINDVLCNIDWCHYTANDQNALTLSNAENGQPHAVTSVCMVNETIKEDEVFIKGYAENEGIPEQLIEQGVIGKELYSVQTGHVQVTVHKILNYYGKETESN